MTVPERSRGIALVDQIRTDILAATLPPGAKLTMRVLSERYVCGATPIREALNQLCSDGLVLRVDKRGFYTSQTSREEFDDILSNRCFLEAEALRRSIARGDTGWEERVVLAHYRLNSTTRTISAKDGAVLNPAWEIAHKAFHLGLLSACGSPILIANCEKLFELNNRYRFLSLRVSERSRKLADEHTAIKDACLARDTDRAVGLLTEHYTETGRYIFDGP